MREEHRKPRAYFGGLAGMGAVMFTHPFDLIKVNLQTQQGHLSIPSLVRNIVRKQGFFALYNGISASMLRQITNTLPRFAVYEIGRDFFGHTLMGSLAHSSLAGIASGIFGTPADLVNVRMQNDVKLPMEKRRNYKHAIDGFAQIIKNEGAITLFSGWTLVAARGTLMTLGQNFCYDLVKKYMLSTPHFKDNVVTHFTSSLVAAAVSTTLTQPLDVIKTRRMNAKPGKYRNMLHIIHHTAKLGPLGFYKGFVPAFLRLGPYTVLLFVFMEQLRLYFGYLPEDKEEDHTSPP
ncbi:mitochondrial dicarboxylate carrier-like [Drosophila bipectinata]|uniref:mitochondrial dicarboxylate carrier-like n=1 Tax=Drosophila bipectinata TaxID=42026 RepID=UPI001C8A5AD8|nr:mitochondrial dicarboxylate carrier-like [Drosophila bipectinata]